MKHQFIDKSSHQYTPGPWEDFIHGHVTSATNGKIIAQLIDHGENALAWAFTRYRMLLSNTQKIISRAPEMVEVLIQLVEIDLRDNGSHRLSLNDFQAELIASVIHQSLGLPNDKVDEQTMRSISMFIHDVVLDQSFLKDHLPGPWRLCGENFVRWKTFAVADVNGGSSNSQLWAASGKMREQQANRQLISMALELVGCLLIVRNALNGTEVKELEAEEKKVIFKMNSLLADLLFQQHQRQVA